MVTMNQPACPPHEHLQAFKVGRLPTDRFEWLLQHLESCSVCRDQMEQAECAADEIMIGLNRAAQAADPLLSEPDLHAMLYDAHPTIAVEGSSLPIEQLGPYRFIRPLGRGGMGAVFLAEHDRLKRRCALKLLPRERVADPDWRGRFDREMQAIASLSHPNIVTANDAGEADGWHYLVMEYLDGLDLATVIRRLGPLDAGPAAKIMADVCAALSAIHQAGLVHRDVKPSNIMLTRSGQVKLLDLGLVHDNRDLTDELRLTTIGQVLGTLVYAAPEQLSADQRIDARTDLYGVGATLYQLLTGQSAHGGQQGIAPLIINKTSRDVDSLREHLPQVSQPLDLLVQQLLRRDPAKRPGTAQAVEAELRALATEDSLSDLVKRAMKTAEEPATHGSKLLTAAVMLKDDKAASSKRARRRNQIAAVAAALIPLSILLGGLVLYLQTNDGTLKLQSDLDEVAVTIQQSGVVVEELSVTTGETITKLHAGQYVVTITSPSDQVKIDEQQVTISRGQETVLVVTQEAGKVSDRTASRPSNGAVMYEGHDLDYWLNVVHNERQLSFRNDALVAVANLLGPEDRELTSEILSIAKQSGDTPSRLETYEQSLQAVISHQGLTVVVPELESADQNQLEGIMLAISNYESRFPEFLSDISDQDLKLFHTALRDSIERQSNGHPAENIHARQLSLRCALKLGEPLNTEPGLAAYLKQRLQSKSNHLVINKEEWEASLQLLQIEDIPAKGLFTAFTLQRIDNARRERISAEIAKRLGNPASADATMIGFFDFLMGLTTLTREAAWVHIRNIKPDLFQSLLERLVGMSKESTRNAWVFLDRLCNSDPNSTQPRDEHWLAVTQAIAESRSSKSTTQSKNAELATRMFRRYDTNGDGFLTADEIEKMLIKPMPADVNADGQVTVQEYTDWLDARSNK